MNNSKAYNVYVDLRDSNGLTDYKVAKGSGVSTAQLSCWKKGAYNFKFDTLAKLAKFFNVEITEFI